MEPPSVPLYRGLIPWQGLLLTASLLTSWNPPTTAQLTVQSMPPSAAEGTDVLLHVHNLTESPLGYYWDKGDRVASTNRILSYVVATEAITPGPTYSNRETIYPNGSLLLQNVTQNDTGYYTIQVLSQTLQSEEATGQLRVYPKLPKPSIASTNSNPVEDKDSVSLTCEPETPDTTYLWWINGQSLRISDRLVMSRDNRTLTLQNITRNDIGPYECGNWNPVSSNRSDPFTLNVLYGPNAPTISPPESYYRPGANLTLSCHADSNPPAQYSWLINERPQQATRELFIASVTVNNSGSYACVAQNSATGCNGTTVKNITVSDAPVKESPPGLSAGAIVGIVIGVLAGVALIAALAYFLSSTSRRASDQHDLTEHKSSASNHSEDHSDNSPDNIDEIAYSSLNFKAQKPTEPTSASPPPMATETIYSEVKKK
ncbi:carcinoembryonic antigen-related cell adhesion molecule 1-like isoform X6 [Nycticebus coucang]|uniref:carcinoembryonic antigen-related cell adhesion molecule 1-like isoform X6 n=1 Tax=Nycticebus coucang TaxID=9470 RepID=UPI00234E0348|nr:carcinoembryonic antigen-related cell adhesion molecule 1-like isoform X6 [Nycticebus coucang]